MARTPWNKGLTAQSDPRVAQQAATRYDGFQPSPKYTRAEIDARYRERLRERDPLGLMAREKRARFLVRRNGGYVEAVDYRQVLSRDGWVCGICAAVVVADDLSFDHIIPIHDGGEHTYDNVRVVHARCNSRKGEVESRDARVVGIRKKWGL